MMKKFALLAVIALMAIGFSCKKETKVKKEGIINFVTGTATINDKGKKTDAKVGDTVVAGMKVETGPKSYVDIYFDQNAIRILENSVVEINVLEFNPASSSDQTRLFVHNGKVFSNITQKLSKDDSYEIRTPTSTAGVRGTKFLVSEEKGKSNVACLDGVVKVKSEIEGEAGEVEVKEEQEVEIEKGKKLTVKDLTDENKKNMMDIINNYQKMKESIRERFEKQRDEIRKAVEDQKKKQKDDLENQRSKDRENVNKQKEKDRDNIDALKSGDRANINKIKGDISMESKDKARQESDAQKEENKKKIDSVKPDIDKFKGSK